MSLDNTEEIIPSGGNFTSRIGHIDTSKTLDGVSVPGKRDICRVVFDHLYSNTVNFFLSRHRIWRGSYLLSLAFDVS